MDNSALILKNISTLTQQKSSPQKENACIKEQMKISQAPVVNSPPYEYDDYEEEEEFFEEERFDDAFSSGSSSLS